MRRRMMKSKIHRARVTDADLNYVGSITLDTELMALADIREWEQVAVLDIDNPGRSGRCLPQRGGRPPGAAR
jgi:aspartate 1-decarboxylase